MTQITGGQNLPPSPFFNSNTLQEGPPRSNGLLGVARSINSSYRSALSYNRANLLEDVQCAASFIGRITRKAAIYTLSTVGIALFCTLAIHDIESGENSQFIPFNKYCQFLLIPIPLPSAFPETSIIQSIIFISSTALGED